MSRFAETPLDDYDDQHLTGDGGGGHGDGDEGIHDSYGGGGGPGSAIDYDGEPPSAQEGDGGRFEGVGMEGNDDDDDQPAEDEEGEMERRYGEGESLEVATGDASKLGLLFCVYIALTTSLYATCDIDVDFGLSHARHVFCFFFFLRQLQLTWI